MISPHLEFLIIAIFVHKNVVVRLFFLSKDDVEMNNGKQNNRKRRLFEFLFACKEEVIKYFVCTFKKKWKKIIQVTQGTSNCRNSTSKKFFFVK